jgi:hypothetical protein
MNDEIGDLFASDARPSAACLDTVVSTLGARSVVNASWISERVARARNDYVSALQTRRHEADLRAAALHLAKVRDAARKLRTLIDGHAYRRLTVLGLAHVSLAEDPAPPMLAVDRLASLAADIEHAAGMVGEFTVSGINGNPEMDNLVSALAEVYEKATGEHVHFWSDSISNEPRGRFAPFWEASTSDLFGDDPPTARATYDCLRRIGRLQPAEKKKRPANSRK